MQISEAQRLVKQFTIKNKWEDEPNIDKFDHIHEELIEMSQYLRYKNTNERKLTIRESKNAFEDGIGDLLFSILRLANQLGVDAEPAFGKSSKRILKKYSKPGKEYNVTMTLKSKQNK